MSPEIVIVTIENEIATAKWSKTSDIAIGSAIASETVAPSHRRLVSCEFILKFLIKLDTIFFVLRSSFPKSSNESIEESNKGHQMLMKMGWAGSGTGLGSQGQGIDTPIHGGDVRDKQDQYKVSKGFLEINIIFIYFYFV